MRSSLLKAEDFPRFSKTTPNDQFSCCGSRLLSRQCGFCGIHNQPAGAGFHCFPRVADDGYIRRQLRHYAGECQRDKRVRGGCRAVLFWPASWHNLRIRASQRYWNEHLNARDHDIGQCWYEHEPCRFSPRSISRVGGGFWMHLHSTAQNRAADFTRLHSITGRAHRMRRRRLTFEIGPDINCFHRDRHRDIGYPVAFDISHSHVDSLAPRVSVTRFCEPVFVHEYAGGNWNPSESPGSGIRAEL